jgi:hypothetical protein
LTDQIENAFKTLLGGRELTPSNDTLALKIPPLRFLQQKEIGG